MMVHCPACTPYWKTLHIHIHTQHTISPHPRLAFFCSGLCECDCAVLSQRVSNQQQPSWAWSVLRPPPPVYLRLPVYYLCLLKN